MTRKVDRVALLGFGRFGRSLAGLLDEAGIGVRALDPHAEVPAHWRADDPAALVDGADAVVLALPVDALQAGLVALRPHLDAEALVLDVASVKRRPVAMLHAVLGDEVPWVATHPLFGPSSVAAGERPLRVVVCPNEAHPRAAAQARALFERLGCVVADQDADEHDRAMARTHALAFFLAKGMLDVGLRADLPFAPPSFRAMARTLAAVQGDAGHLFATIERDNPHAAPARRALLDALTRIDAALASDEPAAGASAAAPASDERTTIPDLGQAAADRRGVGELIAECDEELVRTLARRSRLVGRLRRERPGTGSAPDVDALRTLWRDELGLAPDALDEALRALERLGPPAG